MSANCEAETESKRGLAATKVIIGRRGMKFSIFSLFRFITERRIEGESLLSPALTCRNKTKVGTLTCYRTLRLARAILCSRGFGKQNWHAAVLCEKRKNSIACVNLLFDEHQLFSLSNSATHRDVDTVAALGA